MLFIISCEETHVSFHSILPSRTFPHIHTMYLNENIPKSTKISASSSERKALSPYTWDPHCSSFYIYLRALENIWECLRPCRAPLWPEMSLLDLLKPNVSVKDRKKTEKRQELVVGEFRNFSHYSVYCKILLLYLILVYFTLSNAIL